MLKMCSSKIFATATKVAQATKLSALMLGGAATVAAVSVLVGASGASALDFNFSFFGDQGVPGTTTGRIYGLVDNQANQSATGVTIFSNPISPSLNGNWSFQNAYLYLNRFSVMSGNITYAEFGMREFKAGQKGNYESFRDFFINDMGNNYISGSNWEGSGESSNSGNGGGMQAVSFTQAGAAEVPFDFDPAFGAALGLPLFIGLRYLKKRVASKKLKYNPTLPVS